MRTRLIELQQQRALTDAEMASVLGVSRPHWNLVKNGRVELSDELAIRAAGSFPELTRDLLELAASRGMAVAAG